ncbi:hypothetical protein LTS18_011898 [Coniosporium uncinatum]|uniref:Uncharacterized protein n=1 Tax=Coniosporium uncinatum TaxID=93489 RepID=A0ACC3DD66_9PEZI|nr:hypothetical protein LTS18_011898 [Coniosporium uncinatum]
MVSAPLSIIALLSLALVFNAVYAQSLINGYQPPNSTGFLMRHGFERVLVQPYGYDGFRVRAWAFRPPNGNEVSFLYDPPLEGYEGREAHGMTYDRTINGSQFTAIRNGNTVVKTFGGSYGYNTRLAFFRIEANGSETLLMNEYSPTKSKNPRYYSWSYNLGYEFATEYSFSAFPDEQIYGIGTQRDHMINKHGQTIDLLNFNSYIPTPDAWSSVHCETASHRTLVDYVIIGAPKGDYDGLQQKLSAATGRAPTPPDWSLGYLHSKLRYENQSEVIQLAENFVKYSIPVSLIVIDYQSWAHQGDWGLDPALWPNVSYMAQRVKDLTGAEMMASLWPSVEDSSANYRTMQTEGYLSATRSGPGTTDSWNGSYIRNIDSTNPDARAFLWDTLRRNYFDQGIKNFWIDQADGGALGEAWENNGQDSYI